MVIDIIRNHDSAMKILDKRSHVLLTMKVFSKFVRSYAFNKKQVKSVRMISLTSMRFFGKNSFKLTKMTAENFQNVIEKDLMNQVYNFIKSI